MDKDYKPKERLLHRNARIFSVWQPSQVNRDLVWFEPSVQSQTPWSHSIRRVFHHVPIFLEGGTKQK